MNSRTGVIYFLEINTNPSVFYEECSSSADHILNIDPMGFDGFIKLIVKAAFKRKERSAPRIKIEYDTEKGFHVVASRDIAKDEKIYSDEVATLTSGKYAREHWTEQRDPLKCSWLKKYAFLIGHDVYRTWHEEADKWLPINHSCDPNAWICYDFFINARKFINKGEEITIDYGTFAIVEGEDNEFECRCGSIDCRRIIFHPANRPAIQHPFSHAAVSLFCRKTEILPDARV
uniref:SET domain-containing protein n=1 Tax=Romanomermis culicivorax TaxID=13658 RepID=A0A915HL26_ROMCU